MASTRSRWAGERASSSSSSALPLTMDQGGLEVVGQGGQRLGALLLHGPLLGQRPGQGLPELLHGGQALPQLPHPGAPVQGDVQPPAAMAPVAAVRRAASRRSRPAKCRVERAPAASQPASSTAVAQV